MSPLKTLRFRLAKEEDAAALLEIYKPSITDSAVTFELEPPSVEEFRQRMRDIQKKNAWIVCESDGEILGSVYASPHRERPAYQWSVETSIYVSARHQGQGVAPKLYEKLLPLLKRQGYFNAYAGITIPHDASVKLHERLGFRPIGVYQKVGYKLGAWHDVGWWALELQPEYAPSPKPPLPIHAIGELGL